MTSFLIVVRSRVLPLAHDVWDLGTGAHRLAFAFKDYDITDLAAALVPLPQLFMSMTNPRNAVLPAQDVATKLVFARSTYTAAGAPARAFQIIDQAADDFKDILSWLNAL